MLGIAKIVYATNHRVLNVHQVNVSSPAQKNSVEQKHVYNFCRIIVDRVNHPCVCIFVGILNIYCNFYVHSTLSSKLLAELSVHHQCASSPSLDVGHMAHL